MFYVDKTTYDNLGFGNLEKYKSDAYKYKYERLETFIFVFPSREIFLG